MRSERLFSMIRTATPLKALELSVDATRRITGAGRLSELCWCDDGRSVVRIYFFCDVAVDRTDRPSKESEPPPLLRMKRSSELTRGIIKRSVGTIALIHRSGGLVDADRLDRVSSASDLSISRLPGSD
jgi:hypothetical protein